MKYIDFIKSRLLGDNARSNLFKKNVLFIYLFQGTDLLLGLVTMPLTLKYLNPLTFGIFLTINSIVEWFSYFDVGMGEGLRNKLAEAIAKNDYRVARHYLSTAYFTIGIIFITLLILFYVVNPFLNWTKILNADSSFSREVTILSYIVFSSFCIKSILSLINKVLFAMQIPAITHFFTLLTRILYMIAILLLLKYTSSSLVYYGLSQNSILISIPIVSSIYFYSTKFKSFAPSIKFIDFKYIKDITNLGFKFFILGISMLVTLLSNNFLISHFIGPSEVTSYNLANKYFSILYMLFIVIVTPMWSAYTDAFFKGDIKWILNVLHKIRKIWFLMVIIMILMLIVSKLFFRLWIGNQIEISYGLSASVALYLLANSWMAIYHSFINGVSKVRLQIILIITGAVINIPVSIFLAVYLNLGSAGIILGTVISILPSTILAPIQTYKILYRKAYGIWGK